MQKRPGEPEAVVGTEGRGELCRLIVAYGSGDSFEQTLGAFNVVNLGVLWREGTRGDKFSHFSSDTQGSS